MEGTNKSQGEAHGFKQKKEDREGTRRAVNLNLKTLNNTRRGEGFKVNLRVESEAVLRQLVLIT